MATDHNCRTLDPFPVSLPVILLLLNLLPLLLLDILMLLLLFLYVPLLLIKIRGSPPPSSHHVAHNVRGH